MKRLANALGALVLLLVLAGAIGFAWLQTSLPQLDGEARAAGLAAPVEVVRDAEGVPHLFARSERDAAFALGYVHAQDRLWQMEFQRRLAQGRLAELLGERAFDTDRLMRTVGFARTAEAITAKMDETTRGLAQAYADGVNALLASHPTLPVEFLALRIEPEPWKPADSVAWLLVMAWDLSGNWRQELARLRLSARLGPERAAEMMPPYPGDVAAPLPDFKRLYAELEAPAARLLALSPPGEAIGSNNWVVSGALSQTGKPLLANDPHLGLQAPALWYLAHLATPQGNVVGGTLPGLPFVVLGRNDRVAWSMTTTNADTQDLFVERAAPGDPKRYLTPQGSAAFEERVEVIRVGSQERRITVRATRHGPVLSDAVKAMGESAPKGHSIALAWAALTPDNTTMRAGFALNRARSGAEVVAALKDFTAPMQNVVYADRDGHVGFIAPARVPVRRADNEASGRVPVPGWLAKYDWEGFIPYDKLPASVDPPSGRIVTANHKIVAPGYKPFISVDWFVPYRADRIGELLAATPKHSLASFMRIQADDVSRLARELRPVALAAKPATNPGRDAQVQLATWKGEMARDSAAALAFAAWYRELTRLVYADELGDLFQESWDMRAPFMIAVMKGERGLERWCDDVRTPQKESCADMAARAFDLAGKDLRARYGSPEGWRWGAAHTAAGDHRPFGFFPVLSGLFNVAPQTAGDTFTVNVGHFIMKDAERPFANRHAPSLRAIYDLADLERSLYMHSTGQSGNVLSPWYANLAERWARVEYITIPTRRESIGSSSTLVLKPGA